MSAAATPIGILAERRQTLAQLAKAQGVDGATVWRWATKGAGGIRLESLIVGGRRVTSVEAFERFVAARTAAADAALSVQAEPAETRPVARRSDSAASLEALGF